MPLLGFCLLLLQAFYLNYILIKHEIAPKNSLITAFIYIILMSQSISALNLNPALCAATFIIPALDRILCTYGIPDPTRDVFSAAFLLALASLFHFASIFLILLLILSFYVFGTFSIRMLFVSIAGVVAVYIYLFLYYFLTDNLEGQWCFYVNWFKHIPKPDSSVMLVQYIVWGLTFSFLLDAFFYTATRLREWNIKIRKIILLNMYFLILGFASMLYLLDDPETAALMISIPIAIFIAGYLLVKRKVPFFLEVYLYSWYIMVFFNNILIAEC
jgi:hypothetical protein